MIPTGLVTFLFTDIEGSTKLAQTVPESLNLVLDRHNTILKEAIEFYHGFVFEIIGDAFCSAFRNPEYAIKAAVKAQLDLANENWKDADIKIRIGIHSGNADWFSEKYNGYITLARTARIMSSAYGEQILVSGDTHELIKNKLYETDADSIREKNSENEIIIEFIDLGERRLKDLKLPVKLYQVTSDGLRRDFPPLKTLDARPNNLPVQLSSFIGRDSEKEEIKSHLTSSQLLTLLGPGGTGKTRLSLQIGAEVVDKFENGVWFVELASLTNPEYVSTEIASVFNLTSDGKKDNKELITNYLREKELLLIMDNCEHLIEECAKVSEDLLRICSKLKILTSSREPLHVSGERIYKIPSLSVPDLSGKDSKDVISRNESIQLFCDRASAVKPEFKLTESNLMTVAKLCRELDGIPLAIELAAARIKILPVEKILEKLDNRFALLTGGKRTSLPRQQTLKALIDWSYDLLSENEKKILMKVSVFKGGWTLEAAENVCVDELLDEYEILDLLSNLTDKSLIKTTELGSEMIYGMLETIRKYAEDKLTVSGESDDLKKKFFNYYINLVKDTDKELQGRDQKEYLKKIDLHYENIREALNYAIETDAKEALKFAAEIGRYWELRGYFREGNKYFKEILEKNEQTENTDLAKALYWIGYYSTFLGQYDEAEKKLEQCLEMFRQTENREWTANTLIAASLVTLFHQNFEQTEKNAEECLLISDEIGNKNLKAAALRTWGVSRMFNGKHDDARKKLEESRQIYHDTGDRIQLAKTIGNQGALEYFSGNYRKAIDIMQESLEMRRELGDRYGIALSLSNLGSAYSMIYDFEKSEEALHATLELFKELGDRRTYATPLNTLGNIANVRHEYHRAIALFKESISISHKVGEKFYFCKAVEGLANSFIELNDLENGCKFAAKYMTMMESMNMNVTETEINRFEEIKSILKRKLSENEFERLWNLGKNLTTEEVLKIALDYDADKI